MKRIISYRGGVSKVSDFAAGLVLAAALVGAEARAENSSAKYCVVDLMEGAKSVKYLDAPPAGGFDTDEYKTTKIVLQRVDAGSVKNDDGERISVSKPFYIGLFKITQSQWQTITGDWPSYFDNALGAVDGISYDMIRGKTDGSKWPESADVDPASFLGLLRQLTDVAFDLPTEAQWLVAFEAKNTGKCSSDLNCGWEWCRDWYAAALPSGKDFAGAASGISRVMRGGVWDCMTGMPAVLPRGNFVPSASFYYFCNLDFGFRLVAPCPEKD